jgi:predicted glycosyltransferase
MPGSDLIPAGWSGWPEGKRFAVVLTHDVESSIGVQNSAELMQRERELGFRSSFNFVPEGSYCAPRNLREQLAANGCEVGVHDLRHNGQLYRSRELFQRNAQRINQYLNDWGAVGFRSGFMLHNLDWLHELNLEYDASTFDTDPFEPQPEGRHTIFPFWIPRPSTDSEHLPRNSASPGYVELPYTLPQDSTLYLLLRENSIEIWKRKLDWLATHGGMVLLDTHPDYMSMTGTTARDQYPVAFYIQLLDYIRSKYDGQYWHALPREVAAWVKTSRNLQQRNGHARPGGNGARPQRKEKIWIDLDNTPHVPFFEPIIDELKARRFPVLITARDAFQVCELADRKGLPYARIGRHHGKNRARKVVGLLQRALLLAPTVFREKPFLGVSHGSRSQILLSNWFRIPSLLIEDYEYCRFPITMRPSWVMAPSIIPDDMLPCRNGNIRKYQGIKEDVYAWKLTPDRALMNDLGLSEDDLVVTVRPPATEAHYHNPQSDDLFEAFMERACETETIKVILLPRNGRQAEAIQKRWAHLFREGKVTIPKGAVDGLNLLWHSDLVVSGGGTMNREAAALGVPVYSIFRGHLGAVDRKLSAEGRLIMIKSVDEVEDKIALQKRSRLPVTEATSRRTLHEIVDAIEEIAEFSRRSMRTF